MKPVSQWIFSAVTSALGAFGVHGAAMAETTEPGAICKPLGWSDTGGLHAIPRGVRNATSASMDVLCPVVRTRLTLSTCEFLAPSLCYKVRAHVYSRTGMTCTLYSYGLPDGGWRGQMSRSVPSGYQTFTLELPQGRVPAGSFQTVQCRLAPASWVFGILPQQ